MPSSHLILGSPFSSCPQSLPASGSFPMSQLFAWDGQSIGVSALASFLPKNTLRINLRSCLSSARNFLIGIALDSWVNLKRAGIFITLGLPIKGLESFCIFRSYQSLPLALIPRFHMVSVPAPWMTPLEKSVFSNWSLLVKIDAVWVSSICPFTMCNGHAQYTCWMYRLFSKEMIWWGKTMMIH